jgi:hypothetical protein
VGVLVVPAAQVEQAVRAVMVVLQVRDPAVAAVLVAVRFLKLTFFPAARGEGDTVLPLVRRLRAVRIMPVILVQVVQVVRRE